ncbi:Hypothetical predicted protein [Mytilus galloprovincialis]|uniref:Transposase Helix-turn-helix domain-containing protein n=1 Tax=Mytilus galloprovincialis TaxID=29158 RepID=A0A8B6BQ61_MYTGA|nr:Hypothetical predicted protein [Mytilus galloprovincialis]
MKLRLSLLSEDPADRFGVSTATVSSVFTTWIRVLSSILGQFVSNPSKEVVRAVLPPSFKNKRCYGPIQNQTATFPTCQQIYWCNVKIEGPLSGIDSSRYRNICVLLTGDIPLTGAEQQSGAVSQVGAVPQAGAVQLAVAVPLTGTVPQAGAVQQTGAIQQA